MVVRNGHAPRCSRLATWEARRNIPRLVIRNGQEKGMVWPFVAWWWWVYDFLRLTVLVRGAFAVTFARRRPQHILLASHGYVLSLDVGLVALGLQRFVLGIKRSDHFWCEGFYGDVEKVLGFVTIGPAGGAFLLSPLLPIGFEFGGECLMDGRRDIEGKAGLVVLGGLRAQNPFVFMPNGAHFPSRFVALLLAGKLGIHSKSTADGLVCFPLVFWDLGTSYSDLPILTSSRKSFRASLVKNSTMLNWDKPVLVRRVVVLAYLPWIEACLHTMDSTACVRSWAEAESGQLETMACLETSNCCCRLIWSWL